MIVPQACQNYPHKNLIVPLNMQQPRNTRMYICGGDSEMCKELLLLVEVQANAIQRPLGPGKVAGRAGAGVAHADESDGSKHGCESAGAQPSMGVEPFAVLLPEV